MPLFPVICPNGHRHEALCAFADLPKQRCETCGAKVEHDLRSQQITVGRTFYGQGSVSRAHFFHPSEVREARQVMGPALDSDSQIHDTGHVTFRNRGQERKFGERMSQLRAASPTSQKITALNAAAKARKAGTYKKPDRTRKIG